MSEEQSIKLKASAMVFSRLMTAQQQLKESEKDLSRAAEEDDFWGGAENAYDAAKRRYDAWSYIMKLVEIDL
jgi:hypothetical protein